MHCLSPCVTIEASCITSVKSIMVLALYKSPIIIIIIVGASPDGYVSCTCCRSSWILEVKCPHCAKETGTMEAAQTRKTFCLKKADADTLTLDRNHQYYFQIQTQLFVTDSEFCDFVVWSEADKELFVECIRFDGEFFLKQLEKVTVFFKRALLLELMAKWFSAPVPIKYEGNKRYCFCNEPASENMLTCMSGSCNYEKFHFACLRYKRKPKEPWVCNVCKEIAKRNNSIKK